MYPRDQIRTAIRNFNKSAFTNRDLAKALPELSQSTISQAIIKMKKEGEVVCCGRLTLPTGRGMDLMKEKNLKLKCVRPTIVRKEVDLKGMRKVWPEYFTDPRIPGKSRFIDNGLRQ